MKLVTLPVILLLLSGCSQSLDDYQQIQPKLTLPGFFSGSSQAFGVLQNWRGQQTLHFSAELCGQWQGNRGDLYEIFQYSDGRTDKRHWQLQVAENGEISGSAEDVVGQASGRIAGNTLYWEYVLRIPQTDGAIDVAVKDWLYLVTPQQLVNRSTLHKFGLTVGELTLSIQQKDPAASCAEFIQRYRQTEWSAPAA
jgi:hypothetical protein